MTSAPLATPPLPPPTVTHAELLQLIGIFSCCFSLRQSVGQPEPLAPVPFPLGLRSFVIFQSDDSCRSLDTTVTQDQLFTRILMYGHHLDIFTETSCPSLCIKERISMIRISARAIMPGAVYVISDLTQWVMI